MSVCSEEVCTAFDLFHAMPFKVVLGIINSPNQYSADLPNVSRKSAELQASLNNVGFCFDKFVPSEVFKGVVTA